MISQKIAGLNLGSRDRVVPNFLNMDIDQHPGVDFVGDVSDLSRFADCSVSEVYASHVLEHFEYHKTLNVLKEWFRVLEDGGNLYVAVPNFARCINIYARTGINEWIVRFLCGDQDHKTAYHYNLFDEESLTGLLKEAGFSSMVRVEEFPFPVSDCSTLKSSIDGKSVSLNMVAKK